MFIGAKRGRTEYFLLMGIDIAQRLILDAFGSEEMNAYTTCLPLFVKYPRDQGLIGLVGNISNGLTQLHVIQRGSETAQRLWKRYRNAKLDSLGLLAQWFC